MVECQLPKLEVAGSTPVIRSKVQVESLSCFTIGIHAQTLPIAFHSHEER